MIAKCVKAPVKMDYTSYARPLTFDIIAGDFQEFQMWVFAEPSVIYMWEFQWNWLLTLTPRARWIYQNNEKIDFLKNTLDNRREIFGVPVEFADPS